MPRIKASVKAFEDWLRKALGAELVEKDLKEKHRKMRQGAFPFLRATYWRWCEILTDVCREAGALPKVLAVGDTHLENFGTWRDQEGRLVWGVNDFDDAAVMPYALDLVRLAASALLSARRPPPAEEICGALWRGYAQGLEDPVAIILERDHRWLREALVLPEKMRAEWWDKFMKKDRPAPDRFRAALSAAMPEPGLKIAAFPRQAGAGSLGKPRIVGRAEWRGGPVIREAKAILPSVWTLFRGNPPAAIQAGRIAAGRFRAPDPHYRVADGLVVRRLSPSSRKIEAETAGDLLLSADMLEYMGRDIASCHADDADRIAAVRRHAKRRNGEWLAKMARKAADAVERDYEEFK